MRSMPFISVVVPVYNEEAVLGKCLAALRSQDYQGGYEIIVVDNACTDRSPAIARAAGARVIHEPQKRYVNALRAGFAAARGEIVACTDADTVVPADWLSSIARALRVERGAVAVGGTFRFHDCNQFLIWFGNLAGRFNWHLAGGNMAVWKWAYERAGGFDPAINMGTDTELGLRLRRLGRVLIDRRLVVDTSGRRLQFAFWHTLQVYLASDLSLILFHRPAVADFSDIRRQYHRGHPNAVGRAAAVVLSVIIFLAYTVETPGSQFFGPVFSSADTTQPVVALTFDDGPSSATPEVLDILDHYGVKGTFFVVGENARRYPDVLRRMVFEGDVVGNHTFDHALLTAIDPPRQITHEIDETALVVGDIAGIQLNYFRPPHGWRNPWMMKEARREHYTVVTWSDSPDDWRQSDPEVIARRVVRNARPGAIILLHDGLDTQASPQIRPMLTALPEIIEALQARGYRFVTVPELIEISRASARAATP